MLDLRVFYPMCYLLLLTSRKTSLTGIHFTLRAQSVSGSSDLWAWSGTLADPAIWSLIRLATLHLPSDLFEKLPCRRSATERTYLREVPPTPWLPVPRSLGNSSCRKSSRDIKGLIYVYIIQSCVNPHLGMQFVRSPSLNNFQRHRKWNQRN